MKILSVSFQMTPWSMIFDLILLIHRDIKLFQALEIYHFCQTEFWWTFTFWPIAWSQPISDLWGLQIAKTLRTAMTVALLSLYSQHALSIPLVYSQYTTNIVSGHSQDTINVLTKYSQDTLRIFSIIEIFFNHIKIQSVSFQMTPCQ